MRGTLVYNLSSHPMAQKQLKSCVALATSLATPPNPRTTIHLFTIRLRYEAILWALPSPQIIVLVGSDQDLSCPCSNCESQRLSFQVLVVKTNIILKKITFFFERSHMLSWASIVSTLIEHKIMSIFYTCSPISLLHVNAWYPFLIASLVLSVMLTFWVKDLQFGSKGNNHIIVGFGVGGA